MERVTRKTNFFLISLQKISSTTNEIDALDDLYTDHSFVD